MAIKILVADEEPMMCELFSYALEKAGFLAVKAADSFAVMGGIQNEQPQLLILDTKLPGMPTTELCKLITDHELRNKMPHAPVFMLCAECDDECRSAALDAGADDCLAKPFRMREFMARLTALLRRAGISVENSKDDGLHEGRISLFPERKQVTVLDENGDGRSLNLTQKETELLSALMVYKGHLVERKHLFGLVWGDQNADKSSSEMTTLDVHICSLRQKIEIDPANPQHIVNIRGKGYIFKG